LLLEAAHQFEQRHPDRAANLPKFNQVKPSLSGFVLGNERLRLPESASQVFLAQPSTQPQLPKYLLQSFLIWGEDALLHAINEIALI
jgi:hypothetical protein